MLVWFALTIPVHGNFIVGFTKLGAIVLLYVLGYLLLRPLHGHSNHSNFLRAFVISLVVQIFAFCTHAYWSRIDITSLGSVKQHGLFYRGVAGEMASVLLVWVVAILLTGRRRSLALRLVLLAIAGLALVTIYATGKRLSLLAPAVAVLVWFIIRYRKWTLPVLFAGALAGYFFGGEVHGWYQAQRIYGRSSLLTGREERYQKQLEVFLSNPFTGAGFAAGAPSQFVLIPEEGAVSPESRRVMDHSAYLGAFAETGIIGGLLFLAWIACCLYESFRYAQERRDDWPAQFGAMFLLLLAVSSIFEGKLLMAGGPLIVSFYVIIGQTGGVSQFRRKLINNRNYGG